MKEDELAIFGQAWTDKDLDTLMSFMTDDSVYGASVGREPGTTYSGLTEIRQGFADMLAHDTGRRTMGSAVIFGDIGVAEWSFWETEDGNEIEIRGCDIFEFSGSKIIRKDAFRKTRK